MFKNNKKYIVIYGNIHFVKGASRYLIVDTYRKKYFTVPKSLYRLLIKYKNKRISDIFNSNYTNQDLDILEDYINFLLHNDLIYLTDDISDISKFIKMPLNWDHYGFITNSVMELKSISQFYERRVAFDELNQLNCMYLQLYFFCKLSMNQLTIISKYFDETEFRSIEIFTQYNPQITNAQMQDYFLLYQRISHVIMYNSPKFETRNYIHGFSSLTYTSQKDISTLNCGIIKQSFFAPNAFHFTESLQHNTCLNRKISIDIYGEIKNCPSMTRSFGNIKEINLLEVVKNPEFQKVWHIKKDEITKCKDCEFRHVCTDCRAYLEDPIDIYSAPLKCGYDPYTSNWEEWSINPLKQQAIQYYGMQELLKQ